MKPRIRYRRGVWCCTRWPYMPDPLGHGNTPSEAYQDWLQQSGRTA